MTEPVRALTISAAQPVTAPYDLAANCLAHAEMVVHSETRVVVFPELSLTGYHLDAEVVSPEDPRLEPLIEACRLSNTLALAGAPVAGDHIGMLAVTERGAEVVYRKMWLGGHEVERFVPGPSPVVVEVDGWRLGLAICRDTGQAEHARETVSLGIHAYVAGALEHATDVDVLTARARRITGDHAVWVVIASFAGTTGDGFDRAAGRSAIWAPGASVLAAAGAEVGELARATLIDEGADRGRTAGE